MAVNLREKRVKVIVGIVDGQEVLKEVDFDKCSLKNMVELLEFSKGTYSHVVVTREFFNKIDGRYNPEEVVEAKRLIRKMKPDKSISKKNKFDNE